MYPPPSPRHPPLCPQSVAAVLLSGWHAQDNPRRDMRERQKRLRPGGNGLGLGFVSWCCRCVLESTYGISGRSSELDRRRSSGRIDEMTAVSSARDRPNVATPLGVQRARPSLQLDGNKIIALVGCHADHVVRRQHHCQRCKRGQLLPRKLCGSTSVFRFGGLPCESRGSQVVPPDAVGPDEP